MNIRSRPTRRLDVGSMTVELVVLVPALMALILFLVFLGRAGGSIEQVRHAADVGARSASLASRSAMSGVASGAAERDLLDNGVNCSSTSVAVSVNEAPGTSSVTVTVSCTVNTNGLSLLAAPVRTVTASSTEVIDRHRGS